MRHLALRPGWLIVVALVVVAAGLRPRLARPGAAAAVVASPPRVFPDLDGVTLPPNIAPPGLRIDEPGVAWYAHLSGDRGRAVEAGGRRPVVQFPLGAWRALLAANRGGALRLSIAVRGSDGDWRRFADLACQIAPEQVDRYLVHRRLTPLYNWWNQVGLYQRDLTSYRLDEVLHGRQFDDGCVNCHTRPPGGGDGLSIGFRGAAFGNGTLVVAGGERYRLDQPVGYGSWHPDGQRVAWSINQVRQFFHAAGEESREVLDLGSGIAVYDLATHTFATTPALSAPDQMATYPCWSSDGAQLYYTQARLPWPAGTADVPPPDFDRAWYRLQRIAYDPGCAGFGAAEEVAPQLPQRQSYVFPRVSPDGRWLLYTRCDFGCFPIHHPESDLGLLDLRTGRERPLAINSDRADSWHCWSTNGRWIAFASKRADGLFTKVYLSYFDASGRAHKPLLVPERDPTVDDTFWYSFNTPELYATPVPASAAQLGRALRSTSPHQVSLPPELAPQPRPATSPEAGAVPR